MKNRICLVLCALLLCVVRSAAADPFIFFTAHPLKIHEGENILLDVNIGGLRSGGTDALLGAFQLTLHFDARLNLLVSGLDGVGLGAALGDVGAGEAVAGAQPPTPGSFTFFEVSLLEGRASECVFCTGPYLEDLQSDSFRLATRGFYLPFNPGPGPGRLEFSASDIVLSDANGNALPVGATIPLTVTVPEPSTPALLLAGFALAALCLRPPRRLG